MVFVWPFREQIFKKSTILDKNIETFIKIRQFWKHTPSLVNRLTNPSPERIKQNFHIFCDAMITSLSHIVLGFSTLLKTYVESVNNYLW